MDKEGDRNGFESGSPEVWKGNQLLSLIINLILWWFPRSSELETWGRQRKNVTSQLEFLNKYSVNTKAHKKYGRDTRHDKFYFPGSYFSVKKSQCHANYSIHKISH